MTIEGIPGTNFKQCQFLILLRIKRDLSTKHQTLPGTHRGFDKHVFASIFELLRSLSNQPLKESLINVYHNNLNLFLEGELWVCQ